MRKLNLLQWRTVGWLVAYALSTGATVVSQEAIARDGKMFIHETGEFFNPRFIVNFPTKRHWRDKSRMEDIDSGLKALVENIQRLKIQSIAVPPLGSGLGGLNWEDVRERIVDAVAIIDKVEIRIYEPF